ncbi:MAG TPA: nitrate reductase cytochrome c-type subunit; periplasmic nitrate reductase electron transfer subunit [Sedimenticola thiotaurini]|uniref:Periplasmic nitrate reductase, electron transfer subunit n=1 Tax=Sedimenticola thiotaurini TaxID=1543721 RepID=A0A831W1W0_9GAMM|nr:nitrate reductase cytochrome c-type subunit; periplasmic nitrate reductase electron transfer subunit [Sedimenticola thiotaurini]
MKKTIVTLLVTFVALMYVGTVMATGGVSSLRGHQGIEDMAKKPTKKKQKVAEGGFERSYKIQPPTIPHKIDKEKINLKVNTCLKCHSEKTYKKKKAPKVGDSHYVTRDGKVLTTISSRRYFCNQCHAPQMDATPLVENTFEGAK